MASLENGVDRNMSKWTTVSTRLVKPEVKRQPEWIEWSLLDLYATNLATRAFSSFVFLYKPEPGAANAENILPLDRLIESLSRALKLFYPFAGRLLTDESGRTRAFCNSQGAVFIHKRYCGIVSDLIDEDDFQPNDYISGLCDVQPEVLISEPSGLPTLIIQVTDFQCGTRCLSTTYSHLLADGFSGTHFLASWAQISRGESVSLMPVHDRSLLMPRKSSAVLDGGPVKFLNTSLREPLSVQLTIPEGGVATKVMKLSKRKIDELKAEALLHADGEILSTADCVSAHLWRLIIKNRNLKDNEPTRFYTAVDGRSRLRDFPAGYFGNVLTAPVVVMTVGELLSKPVGKVAAAIHKAIKAMDDEVIRGTVDWLSVNNFHLDCFGDEPFMPGDPTAILHTVHTSWINRFPFFELDFGGGKPSGLYRNATGRGASSLGKVHVLPTVTTSTEGDLKLSLFGEKSMVEKVEIEV
ncbi:hypothetical protein R1sor_025391 [Riccia sorocarpa]|uniref:Uncharacterized protein n=1 Tax=Riccia sorocarpa TaxID=122646 RepID=A0ABD3G909_9MARC